MAYDAFSKDDETAPVVAPAAPAGPPAPVSSGAAPGTTPTPAPAARQNFVGFDRYFAANTAGANRMAGDVAGKVDAAVGTARQTADKEFNVARGQVNAGVTTPTITQDSSGGNPTQYDAQEATYSGPTSFNYSTAAQDQVRNAGNLLNQTGSVEGLETFFQGGPSARSRGMNRFDAVLTGAAGADEFSAARQGFQGLNDYLSGTTGRFDTAVAAARAEQAARNAEAYRQERQLQDYANEAFYKAHKGARGAAEGEYRPDSLLDRYYGKKDGGKRIDKPDKRND